MSLNHRRRIFRADTGALLRGRSFPAPNVLLVTLGGVAALLAVATLFGRSSDAPARVPANQQLSAPADKLAVIDGETLRVGDHVVRLDGILAPARGSLCHGATAAALDCGVAAANKLASLVSERQVACTIHGSDRMGRPVAACLSAGVPLGEALVRSGWARALTADLQPAEAAARADGLGIWRTVSGS
ncbi:thermonuclease family protein [Rhodopila sp.]|uniref:thermonuclease family protein n=1 Tax=Rhodopila sp. TaxID=2480087 RepID=UPI003D1016FC